MSTATDSTKVIFLALMANLGIAFSKFIGAYFSKSSAMFSEAIHSLVDSTNQVLLLLGTKRAQLPPTEKHPMGYGAESFFWSFMVAILLFSLGGMVAIYEGIHKFHSGDEIHAPWLSLGILVISLILESISFNACLNQVKVTNPHGSLWQWFKKTTSAELLVVFTEDLAALLGLVIATIALLTTWITGNSVWDAIGSMTVGALLVGVAVLLSIEIRSLMIGEAPAKDFRTFIEKTTTEIIPGGHVLRFLAVQLGGNRVMISYKIHPGEVRDVASLIDMINRIEKSARAEFPEIAWQFVEPDYSP
ncbi:MAG: cation diffusion facilitator family transporter [Bdellovibrionales bacterium]|nr:cation diffusion facilitator family transporter [Bdellovibrionales bacterium]